MGIAVGTREVGRKLEMNEIGLRFGGGGRGLGITRLVLLLVYRMSEVFWV